MAITKINNLGITFPVPFTAGTEALPSLTFAGDTNTGIFAPAADTIAFTEGGTESLRIDSSANLQFNSGFGSVATAFGCRAWVNFNGTGTVAIRGSGNVSSITDNGVGSYRVNFTTAMPDANYAAQCTSGLTGNPSGASPEIYGKTSNFLTSSVGAATRGATGGANDQEVVCVSVFR